MADVAPQENQQSMRSLSKSYVRFGDLTHPPRSRTHGEDRALLSAPNEHRPHSDYPKPQHNKNHKPGWCHFQVRCHCFAFLLNCCGLGGLLGFLDKAGYLCPLDELSGLFYLLAARESEGAKHFFNLFFAAKPL